MSSQLDVRKAVEVMVSHMGQFIMHEVNLIEIPSLKYIFKKLPNILKVKTSASVLGWVTLYLLLSIILLYLFVLKNSVLLQRKEAERILLSF